MKAIRLMPAYCAARSCEMRPWRYQSIAAARRISLANVAGDSAIGARRIPGQLDHDRLLRMWDAHVSLPSSIVAHGKGPDQSYPP